MEMFPLIREYVSKRGRGISFPMIEHSLRNMWEILKDIPNNYEEDPL